MKTRRKKNNITGSTHTFIFTHAPIVDGTIFGKDATHVSPNDYRFVYWVMNPNPAVQRPNVEAVFCGHTHVNVWDFIKGLKGKYTDDDRDIKWYNTGKGDFSYNTIVPYFYTDDLLSIQMPRSTGG